MEWLTVVQASQKYSLSQSAVKRLIYKLEKEKPTLVKKQGRLNFISAAAFVHPNDSERSPNVHRTNNANDTERKAVLFNTVLLICILIILILLFVNIV